MRYLCSEHGQISLNGGTPFRLSGSAVKLSVFRLQNLRFGLTGLKGNQDSVTPLDNGRTEGQSLGKAIRDNASVEERQRGTTERC